MAPTGSNKKVANSLVTLSSAAILAVYAAGLMKTRAAAEQMEAASNERRPTMPAPATAGETTTPPPIEPPADVAKPTLAKSPAIPSGPVTETKAPGTTSPSAKTAEVVKAEAVKTKAVKAAPVETAPAKVDAVPATVDPAPVPVAAATAPTTAATAPVVAANIEEPPAPPLPRPKDIYNDGTYLGWGTSRHGDIQASVKIEDGRIVAASIAQCWTRYSCSWVAHLPPQVVKRQSPDVDYVSGATQSANAFYWAVIDALTKAK